MYIFVIKLFYVFKYNLFLYKIEFISDKKYRNFNDWKKIIVMYIKTAYNRSDTVGYGRIRSDTVEYGRIRSDTVRYGQIRSDTVRYGQIRSDTVRYGQIRSDTVRYGYGYGAATEWLRYGYGTATVRLRVLARIGRITVYFFSKIFYQLQRLT
jgi:hypothetical protein